MMIGPARSPMLCCSRTERISVLFLTELRMRIMMTSLGIDHSQRSGHYLLDEVPTDSCESLPQDHLLSKEIRCFEGISIVRNIHSVGRLQLR